jgi:hypothetical protein
MAALKAEQERDLQKAKNEVGWMKDEPTASSALQALTVTETEEAKRLTSQLKILLRPNAALDLLDQM